MKREAKAYSNSMVTEVQNKVYNAIEYYNIKKDRGDKDLVDTYERGFIDAMKLINRVYGLEIDFYED